MRFTTAVPLFLQLQNQLDCEFGLKIISKQLKNTKRSGNMLILSKKFYIMYEEKNSLIGFAMYWT